MATASIANPFAENFLPLYMLTPVEIFPESPAQLFALLLLLQHLLLHQVLPPLFSQSLVSFL